VVPAYFSAKNLIWVKMFAIISSTDNTIYLSLSVFPIEKSFNSKLKVFLSGSI